MTDTDVHIDYSFLESTGVTDEKFKGDVIDIFLNNAPAGVDLLEEYVQNWTGWEMIYKQAHYLKSSFSVIKINNINELLFKIEQLSKKEEKADEIKQTTAEMVRLFKRALPVLLEERRRIK